MLLQSDAGLFGQFFFGGGLLGVDLGLFEELLLQERLSGQFALGDGVSFGDDSALLVVRLQNLAHDAVGTGGLRHAGTGGHGALVAGRTAGGTPEIGGAGAVGELASVGH